MSFANIKPLRFNPHSFIEIDEAIVDRFIDAARRGDVSLLSDMLHDGVPVDGTYGYGHKALREAAINNRADVARVLLQEGADVNKLSRGGETVLHIASRNNSTNVIRELMQHGASAIVKNNFGKTPMDIARVWNREEAISIMEQYQVSAFLGCVHALG